MSLTVVFAHLGSSSRWVAPVQDCFALLAHDVHAGQDEELYDVGDLNDDALRAEDLNSEEYQRTYNCCE